MSVTIFISGSVPSSKNGKIFTGKFLVWSKAAQKYRKDTKGQWLCNKDAFLALSYNKPYPLKVSFKFIRGSKHKFDYVNPLQTILDLMVEYQWIPDDNADIILPVFEPYEYNKTDSGVVITIL